MKKIVSVVLALFCVLTVLSGCSSKPAQKNIAFADVGWDSIRLQNAAAGLIATTVFGYDSTSEVSGSTPIAHEAMIKGEIDVHMEIWTDNISVYDQDLKAGRFQEMGINFDDNGQGLYVPRYVIEGDSARGIAPTAPDLRTVKDLKN
ncbi:MAG TPA: glycine betaine ABC transporter substrate-binding protein, partial [Clostridia bacterium]|nr:glycine betaine ABC transporter substrate-binding protein [Clostridia bacterium]